MSVIPFPNPDGPESDNATPGGPTADEGLQLIHAFMKIENPDLRAQLIRIAERFAQQGPQQSD